MSEKRRANDTLPTVDMSKTLVDHVPANAEPSIEETARHTPIAKAKSLAGSAGAKTKKRASIAPASKIPSMKAPIAKTKSLPPPATSKTASSAPPAKTKAAKVASLSSTLPATEYTPSPVGASAPSPAPVPKGPKVAVSKAPIGSKVRARRSSFAPPASSEEARPTLASVAPEDQVSIPPATSDVSENMRLAHAPTERLESLPPVPAADTEPDARHMLIAARGGSSRWLRTLVGVAAVLSTAALVRVTIARFGHKPEQTAQAAAQVQTAAQPQLPPPPPVEEQPQATAPATPPKTAAEEKKGALAALEKRNLTEAIAAGERSVDLDPTDADAWRVLGAAYQDAGRMADARRCFQECAKVAKKGEVKECNYLLQ